MCLVIGTTREHLLCIRIVINCDETREVAPEEIMRMCVYRRSKIKWKTTVVMSRTYETRSRSVDNRAVVLLYEKRSVLVDDLLLLITHLLDREFIPRGDVDDRHGVEELFGSRFHNATAASVP